MSCALTPSQLVEAQELRDGGVSADRVAALFRCSPTTIKKHTRRPATATYNTLGPNPHRIGLVLPDDLYCRLYHHAYNRPAPRPMATVIREAVERLLDGEGA